MKLCSFTDLQENMDSVDDEADENRLLPAMNKIWSYLILCLENKVSVVSDLSSVLDTLSVDG